MTYFLVFRIFSFIFHHEFNLSLLSSEKIGRLNELWEIAFFIYVKENDLESFKKLVNDNKELLNWQHEEPHKIILLRGMCERDDRDPLELWGSRNRQTRRQR